MIMYISKTCLILTILLLAKGETVTQAPESAVILFNGKDLNNWTTRDGSKAVWRIEDGVMNVVPRGGDIHDRRDVHRFYASP